MRPSKPRSSSTIQKHLAASKKAIQFAHRTGDKIYVSNIVFLGKLTAEQLNNEDLFARRIAGALQTEDYLDKMVS